MNADAPASRRTGDVTHSRADDTRLRSLFPEVEPTPLREGLEQTVQWFRTSGQWSASGTASGRPGG